jgi:hypothetical protein
MGTAIEEGFTVWRQIIFSAAVRNQTTAANALLDNATTFVRTVTTLNID